MRMLVVSESHQNYQNGAVIIQLTDIGSGSVGDSGLRAVQVTLSVHTIVYFWIYVNLSRPKST
jgi:hypothetical protein